MLYHLHEFKNSALWPAHVWSEATDIFLKALNADDPYSRFLSASSQVIERTTRIFPRPDFGIKTVERDGITLELEEEIVKIKPFCQLRYFKRMIDGKPFENDDPIVLMVAPLSGHFATLLRDTVRAMASHHNVYITDWNDAKEVPLREGPFTFENYVDYLLDFMRFLGDRTHIIAVCQPAVPVICATSLLAEYKEECQPLSMTLMGGPIDASINPGKVNIFAKEHDQAWYRRNLIAVVPSYYKGGGRAVCPGFIMLTGFMNLNLERHQEASFNLYKHLIVGDQDNAEVHRRFYDEYRAVLDLPADYFLESVKHAFQEFSLPRGKMTWRGYPVRPEAIKKTALLTVEGELDDISCPGQTYAAHGLCPNIPARKKFFHFQKEVGHYGIFNGRRWRTQIQPVIAEFIQRNGG